MGAPLEAASHENARGIFGHGHQIRANGRPRDPKLKAEFERQAAAYRKLAEKRAKEYGLKPPSDRR